jgi:hypothetical protein
MIDDSSQVAWLECCVGGFKNISMGKREGLMTSGVRILKRGSNDSTEGLPVDRSDKKNDQQRNREIVITVKSWIAELDIRRLSRRTEALRLIK